MNSSLTPVRLGLLMAIVALQACDSSSDSDPAIRAQAVDGYIVAADVSCDNVDTGNGTAAAGRFTCPAGTSLMNISGGQDVGFDEQATGGGVPFIGELNAPGNLAYVTPLSTLAVAMSVGDDGEFDASAFNQSTSELAGVFGQSSLDLNGNPATVMQIVRLNAQVHQVVSAFAENPDGYGEAIEAFAETVKSSAATGKAFSLSEDAGLLLEEINAQLTTAGSALKLSSADLESLAVAVAEINTRLGAATGPEQVVAESMEAASSLAALTLLHDDASVAFTTSSGFNSTVSLADFSNASLFNGGYRTLLSTLLSEMSYNEGFVKVNRDLDDVRASLGFEMTSTTNGDQRSLTYVTDDAYFSATEGDSASLTVSVGAGAMLHVRSVSRTGVVRNVTIELTDDHAFTNGEGKIIVNHARVSEELAKRGIDDVLQGDGNFEVKFVISGLRVNSQSAGVTRANGALTLTTSGATLAGNGIKGYVTILDNY